MEKSVVKGRVKMTGEERTPKQLRRETRAVEREWMWEDRTGDTHQRRTAKKSRRGTKLWSSSECQERNRRDE